MYNIYKITNSINGKAYIGKTMLDINVRFQQHKNDSKKPRREHRPLYNAMNKYGTNNFTVELIEIVDTNEKASEREIYWIDQYRTFVKFADCNGYNATMGGDGKQRLDHNRIIKTFNESKSQKETAIVHGIHIDTVSKILKSNQISTLSKRDVAKKVQAKPILMLNKDNETIKQFESVSDAAMHIVEIKEKGNYEDIIPHIIHVCQGKRKTAYGFIWKYK